MNTMEYNLFPISKEKPVWCPICLASFQSPSCSSFNRFTYLYIQLVFLDHLRLCFPVLLKFYLIFFTLFSINFLHQSFSCVFPSSFTIQQVNILPSWLCYNVLLWFTHFTLQKQLFRFIILLFAILATVISQLTSIYRNNNFCNKNIVKGSFAETDSWSKDEN